MTKKLLRDDPIYREKREPREDRIHPAKNTTVIEKMYNDFISGIEKLQKDMAKGKSDEELAATRKKLGEKGWSLQNLYGYKIQAKKMKELGIVLSMGKVIPHRQSGSEIKR